MKLKLFLSWLFVIYLFSASEAFCAEKALYVSLLRDPVVLSDRKEVDKLIDYAVKKGYRELFVQVYRANRAYFSSTHAESKANEMAYLIQRAHEKRLAVHAWLNLLSLSANERAPILKKYGTSILTCNTSKKKSLKDYRIDNQYFLEPGDPRVVQELAAIVRELVFVYPGLDGVHLDYIRYPDVKPSYGHTEQNVLRYRASGGKSTDEKDENWRRWKRDQVTALVRRLKEEARDLHPDIQVSTSGLMMYVRAREESFQDWKLWVDSGLVDFVTLMCYTDDMGLYQRDLLDAGRRLPGLEKVNIAVGAYKMLKRPILYWAQWDLCENTNARACVALEYGSIPGE